MKAEEPKSAEAPVTTTVTDPTAPTPHSGPPPETVGEGIKEMWDGAKAAFAQNVNPKVLAGVIAVVVVGGLWWYLAQQNRKSASAQWSGFEQLTTAKDLDEFIKNNPKTTVGKVARMEQARIWLGPEGIAFLSVRDKETRKKGIEAVEKARDEFTKLSAEFDDVTLKGEALRNAAEAELALVGIPKDGGGSRGSVDVAVELYRKLAKLCGETTPAGESAKKRADDLAARATQVADLGKILNERMSPLPTPDIKPPADIKPPEIPNPTPPPDIKPPADVKPPVPPVVPPPTKK